MKLDREEIISTLEAMGAECEGNFSNKVLALIVADAQEINELATENKRLRAANNRLKVYDEERDIALHARLIKEAKAEAVKEFEKHAYWFFTEYEYFTCSECGDSYYNGSDTTDETRKRLEEGIYYPYCPHCGAKMDAEPPKRKERKNRDV